MATVERSLRVNITATTRGFSTALRNANERLNAFERRLMQTNNQARMSALGVSQAVGSLGPMFGRMSRDMGGVAQESRKVSKGLNEVTRNTRTAGVAAQNLGPMFGRTSRVAAGGIGDLSKSTQKLRADVSQLPPMLRGMGQTFHETTRKASTGVAAVGAATKSSAAQVVTGTRTMTAGFKDVRRHGNAMLGDFESYAGFVGFQMLGRQAIVMGAAIAGAMGLSVKAFAEFEDSFALVRKTTEATEAEFGRMSEQIRELARTVPLAVNELNEVAGVAGQLGVPTDDIVRFTEVMAKMGVTTNLTAEQAAMSMARIANVMQVDFGQDTERMGAAIVDLGNNFAAQEDEIVRFTERIAAGGQVVGMSTSDILAFSTAFTSVGVRAERGGTAFQRVIFDMMNQVNEGGESLEILAKTAGVTAAEFARTWSESPTEAVLQFIEGLGRAGEESSNIMSELFGNNVRTTQSFLSLAGAGDLARRAVELGNEAWDKNIALNNEAETRFGTLINRLRVFGNQIRDVAIGVGQQLAPIVENMVAGVTRAIQFFGDLPKPIRDVAMGMAAAASAALMLGGSMALAVFPMRVLQGMLPNLSAQWGRFTGQVTTASGIMGLNSGATHANTAAKRANVGITFAQERAMYGLANSTTVATGAMSRVTGVALSTGAAFRSMGAMIATAGRAVMGASLVFAKAALAAAAMYAVYKGGETVVSRLKGDFIDTTDAAEQLALSFGETLGGYQHLESATKEGIRVEFSADNRELIDSLSLMNKTAARANMIRIGVDMVQRGMDPEKVNEAITQLAIADGRNISIGIDFGAEDFDYADAINGLMKGIPGIANELSGAFSIAKVKGHDLRNELGQIASTLGTLAFEDAYSAGRAFEQMWTDLEANMPAWTLDKAQAAFFQMDVAVGGLAQSLGATAGEVQAIENALNEAGKAYDPHVSGVERLRMGLADAARTLELQGNWELAEILREMAGLKVGNGIQDLIDQAREAQGYTAGAAGEVRGLVGLLPQADGAARGAAGAMAFLGEAFTDLESEIETVHDAIDAFFSDLRGTTDPIEAAVNALHEFNLAQNAEATAAAETASALATYNEAVKEHGRNSDEARTAQEKLTAARHAEQNLVFELIGVENELAEAITVLTAEILEGNVAMEDLTEIQDRVQEQFGLSDEAAGRLTEALMETIAASPEILRHYGLLDASLYDLMVALGLAEEKADKFAGMTVDAFQRLHDKGSQELEALGINSVTASETISGALEQGGRIGTEALLRHLRTAGAEVPKIVATYAAALKLGLDPVLTSIGGKPIALLHGSDVKLHRMNPDVKAADGAMLPDQATIKSPGTLVQWAEPETGGEAFIPLARNKRRRSLDIWAETGRRLGLDVPNPDQKSFAAGGFNNVDYSKMFTSASDVPPVPDYPYNGFARSAHNYSEVVRNKAIEKIAEFAAQTGHGSNLAATVGLNPQFLARFRAWSNARGPFSITSGYRSSAQQAILYARYKAGKGPLAAPPGRSNHEKGLAIDHAPHSWPIAATARPFGLKHPVRSESWHVEPMAKGGILNPHIRDGGGPLRPGYTFNGTGRNEMVVPMANGGIIRHGDFDPRAWDQLLRSGGWTGRPGDRMEALYPAAGTEVAPQIHRMLLSAGDSADSMAQAIENATRALSEWQRQIERQEEAERRRELVITYEKAKSAKGDEFDQEAVDSALRALQEYDRERARANERRVSEERIAAAEAEEARRREIEANRQSLIFDAMSTKEKIAHLSARMAEEQKFSDAWMRLHQERNSLLDDLHQENLDRLAEAEKVRDELHRDLVAFVKREQELNARRAKAEQDYADASQEATDRVAKQQQDLMRSREEALRSWARLDERVIKQWGNTARATIRNVQQQTEMMRQHREGIAELRARGLDETVIQQLGLDDPASLGQVEMFLRATDAELAELSNVVQARNAEAHAKMLSEASNTATDLGKSLADITEQLNSDLASLGEDLDAELARLIEDVANRGKDQGMTYGEAIIAGMQSQIPGIVAMAEELQSAQSGVKSAQRAVDRGAAARDIQKATIVREASRAESRKKALPPHLRDAKLYQNQQGDLFLRTAAGNWYNATGDGQRREARRLYGSPTKVPNNHIGPIADSMVNLFGGPKMMETFEKTYDVGGILPPGLTMAYNGTRQAEYVLKRHDPGPSRDSGTVIVEVHHTTNVDGEPVAKAVTRHQGRMDRNRRVRVGSSGWSK